MSPFKNLQSPAKNDAGSNLPETDVQDIEPGKKVRQVPLVNEERTDLMPQHNPAIDWPKAEGPDKRPMKNLK